MIRSKMRAVMAFVTTFLLSTSAFFFFAPEKTFAAAPTGFTSQTYQDTNADGVIDQVVVVINGGEALTTCTVTDAEVATDWTYVGNDIGGSLTAAGDLHTCVLGTATVTLKITGANASTTGHSTAPTIAYDNDDTDNSIANASGNLGTVAAANISDGAAPVVTSVSMRDQDANGKVDRLALTFTENLADTASGANGFDVTSASDHGSCTGETADPSVSSSLNVDFSCATANTAVGDLTLGFTQNIGIVDAASNQTVGNTWTSASTPAITDGAAPVIRVFWYKDNDGDGKIDRFTVNFSETVTAASVLAANDLTLTNVGDFTGAAFGADTTDLVTASVSSVEVNLGTESSVADTFEDSGNLAISSQNAFSLTDGTNTNSTLGAQLQAFSDFAAPVVTAVSMSDQNSDGLVDRLALTFTENLADTASGDNGFDVTSAADHGSCTGETADPAASPSLNVDFSCTTVNTAVGDLTLGFTQNLGIKDSNNNQVVGNTWTSASTPAITDSAIPVYISSYTLDNNNNGTVDFVKVIYSESISDASVAATDFEAGIADTTAGNLTESFTSGEPSSGNETDVANDKNIYIGVVSNGESLSGNKTDYTLKIQQVGAVSDAVSNTLASFAVQTSADSAKPKIVSRQYQDNGSNGGVDRLVVYFTENVTWNGSDAGQFDITANDLTGFTGVTAVSGGGTIALTLTVSSTANLTGVSGGTEPTLKYTVSGTPANHVKDTAANPNDLASEGSASSITDAAPPIPVGGSYKDINLDGQVDRVDVIFTENLVKDAYTDAQYSRTAGTINISDVTGSAVSTTDLRLDVSAEANKTGAQSGVNVSPQVIYTAGTDLRDAASNFVATFTQTVVDAAPPSIVSVVLSKTGGGRNRITLTYTEDMVVTAGASSGTRGDITVAGTVAGFGSFATTGGANGVTVPTTKNTVGHSANTPTVTIDLAAEAGGTLGGAYPLSEPSGNFTPVANPGVVDDTASPALPVNVSRAVAASGGPIWDLVGLTVTAGSLHIDSAVAVVGCAALGNPAVCETGEKIRFTWNNPVSDGATVSADLLNFGGSATQAMYDDGTNGDVTLGDNIYSYLYTVVAGDDNGSFPVPVTVVDTAGNVTGPVNSTETATVYNISTGALTATNVNPASLAAGSSTGVVTVNFTTTGAIPANGKIKVTFPSGYLVSGANSGACSTMGTNGTITTTVSGQVVTLARSLGDVQTGGETETCTIAGIRNPQVSGDTGVYAIATTTSLDVVIDQDLAVETPNGDAITAGALTATSVSLADPVMGHTGNVTFNFTTANPIPNNGKIVITFPGTPGAFGFGSVVATCSTMSGSFAFSSLSPVVTLTRSGGSTASPGVHTCTLTNIINPSASGLSGPFAIKTTTVTPADIDENTSAGTVTISPNVLTSTNVQPVLVSGQPAAGAVGTVTVTFTSATSLPNNGKIKVTFPTNPQGFSFDSGGASVGDCTFAPGGFTTGVVGQEVTLTRTGGASEGAGAKTCTITNVKNPVVTGSTGLYGILLTDGADVPLDQDSAVTADTITVGSLASANVEPTVFTKGTVNNVGVTFTATNPVPGDGQIIVTFPSGFVLGVVGATGNSYNGTTFAPTVSGQSVVLTGGGGGGLNASEAVAITLSNITNPNTAGPTGTYTVETRTSGAPLGTLIDQNTLVASDVIFGLRNAVASVSNPTINQATNLNFSFKIAQLLPAAGQIEVVVPPQILLPGSNGMGASNLVGITGTLTAAQVGQTLTFTRAGGANVDPNTVISFSIGGALNGSSAGSTNTFTFRTKTAGGVDVLDEETLVPGVALAVVPVTPAPTPAPSGGGGGGGGGGTAIPSIPADSNTRTSTIASTLFSAVSTNMTYSRPISVPSNLITSNAAEQTKTAELTTASGTITLRPNSKSTISLFIPGSSTVIAEVEWDGVINPPLVQSVTKVSVSGDVVENSTHRLARDKVAVVLKVGSDKSELMMSQKATIRVPVDVADGTNLKVYSSLTGHQWKADGEALVSNGEAEFEINHLTYFALERTGGAVAPVERVVVNSVEFLDILGHWAEQYIIEIARLGIVSGKREGIFAPNDNITRAELTKVVINAFGFEVPSSVSENPFEDVDTDTWYAPYVAAARDNGIVSGVGEGGRWFNPNAPVTRAEAMKILLGAAKFGDVAENFQANYASHSDYWYAGFKDVPMGEWFAKYVAYAKDFGIVGGYADGTFGPGNPMTRAEAAKVILKVLELKGK